MHISDISAIVFGVNGEKVESALSLPFVGKGATWDAINAYLGHETHEWGDLLTLVEGIQREEGWGYVYVIKGTHSGVERMKIGKANDLQDRLKMFNVKIPFDIETVAAFYVPQPLRIERSLHVMMGDARLSGEWFDLTPSQLQKVKLAGFAAEQDGWSGCWERVAAAYRENKRMPDAEYIEYLELLLAMSNIPFQRNGAIGNE